MNNNKKEENIGINTLLVGNLRWPTAPLFKSSFENLNKTKENGITSVGGVGKLSEPEVLLNKYLRMGGQKNESK